MSGVIVQSNLGITLLGAGLTDHAAVSYAMTIAPCLVAADGGATSALAMGLMPEAVIGDFDSVDAATLAQIPPERQHRIAEQDSTDFDKCLRSLSAPFILAVGFTAPRLDHTLAVFTGLARHPGQCCIVLGETDLCFLCPPRLDLDLPVDSRLSLFPLSECTGRSTGLRWAIDGLAFSPAGIIGTSNQTISPSQSIRIDRGAMLVILPRETLPLALAGLRVVRGGTQPVRGE